MAKQAQKIARQEITFLNEVIGAPFSFYPDPPKSFCCATLVQYARKYLGGLETPFLVSTEDYSSVLHQLESPPWKVVRSPKFLDVVVCLEKNAIAHLGVVLSGRDFILHAYKPRMSCGQVFCTPMVVFNAQFHKGIEYWRLK